MNKTIEFIKNNNIYTPDFTIEQRVGTGGFGLIYRVKGNFKTPAVIKIGDVQLINEYSMYETFSKIIPTNIPKYYEFGECLVNKVKQYYIIIEYIEYSLYEGDNSLVNQFSNKTELIPIYMNIYNELIDILNTIHQHGYIHNDIKPSNILIKQVNGVYIPILIDFGLIDSVIDISGDQAYYAGTRCYSSIYQHFGMQFTPIDDYINLVYTWMKVITSINKGNNLPWDITFIRQDKKKHEFYAYEKWMYTKEYSSDNFFDKVLRYLYNLQHFWSTVIDVKKLYYIDPLQKYSFEIHSIVTPSHWKKFIKQESLTISKIPYLNEQLKDTVCVDEIIKFIKIRRNFSSKINIADYSLVFMQYMIKQYNKIVSYMWNNMKKITEIFMNKCPQHMQTYLMNWISNIQQCINKDITIFDNMISSVNVYMISDIFSFFNYKRLQNIMKSAVNKLPPVDKFYSESFANDYIEFRNNIVKLYNREI